jgi:hypothetical protein
MNFPLVDRGRLISDIRERELAALPLHQLDPEKIYPQIMVKPPFPQELYLIAASQHFLSK